MLHNQVCNRHGGKSNRWSLSLSLSVRRAWPQARRTAIQSSPSSATLLIAARRVARRIYFKLDSCAYKQVALLWQRDRATRLSVEILQLQNIPFEN